MNEDNGIRHYSDPGWIGQLKYWFAGVVGAFGIFLVARQFLQEIYRKVGTDLAADLTLLLGMVVLCAVPVVLGIVVVVAYIVTRISKHQQAPVFLPTVAAQPMLTQPESRIARLPSGNWAAVGLTDKEPPNSTRREDNVELAFTKKGKHTVTLAAWQTVMAMPKLSRAGWPHTNAHYSLIRAYLIERGAADTKGNVNAQVLHRLNRDVMRQL